ncbi:MAG: hypothetical protein AB7O67_18875 [Vicinamibacterales bacterium]
MGLEGQGASRPAGGRLTVESGYAMAALLVGLAVMAVLMTAALPVWTQAARREKETELVWRGEQYARALELFQRKFANAYPPSIDVLVEQKFLRKKYKDPITNDDFQPIYLNTNQVPGAPAGAARPGQATRPAAGGATQPTRPGGTTGGLGGTAGGPIVGVTSKSDAASIRLYNGRGHYNEWQFVHVQTQQRVNPQGGQQPGAPQPGAPRPGIFGPSGPGGQGQRPPGMSPTFPGPSGGQQQRPQGRPPGQ